VSRLKLIALLVTGKNSPTVEVAHEELLRSWQVFQDLIQEKEKQELKLERTQRELTNQLLEKERTKNKFLLALTGATFLTLLAGLLGWLVWQGKEQERLLQISIDIHNGQLESETINLLPKLIEQGNKYQTILKNIKTFFQKLRQIQANLHREDQFTEGALQETYKILIMDLGADINKSGYIGNEEEAGRMPEEILHNIEFLWRKYTNQKCGWFGKDDNLKASECKPLKGATLSSLIFYGPTDAQKRLEEVGISNPVSNKCIQKSIFDLRESLSKSNKISSQQIGNYLKITGGSSKIINSQYSQLIPIGISMGRVTGGYDPNNRQMMLEINGRLLDI
jgi:hypothetical protein